MRNLSMKTVKESTDLVNVYSNQTITKDAIIQIIDEAKRFQKGKSLDKLIRVINSTEGKYPTKPGEPDKEIHSTGETAYQRAVVYSKRTKLDTLGEIEWKDFELPVVFNKNPRRRCVDLIGKLENNVPVLCELKYATEKNKSNSPVYAAIEMLIYYYFIRRNNKMLEEEGVFHGKEETFKWSDFNGNSILVVGANRSYWQYWVDRYKRQNINIELWRNSLPVNISFFSSDDFNFQKQKGGEEPYLPSVLGKTEWTEVHL